MNYFTDRYEKRRNEAITILGGKCANCDSISDLELDHVDPETKTIKATEFLRRSREVFLAELKKCQLLCGRCHINKTRKEAAMRNKGFCKNGHLREDYNLNNRNCRICQNLKARDLKRRKRAIDPNYAQ